MPKISYTCKPLIVCIFCVWMHFNSFSQNPIAYFPFNNNAIDKSGNRNNGTLYGNVISVPDRFGNPCSAYYFDGKTGYIKVPTSSSLESPEYGLTICVWYKLSASASNNIWLTTICKGEGSTELIENPQYRLQVQQNKDEVNNACSLYYPSASSTISLNTSFTNCDFDFSNHLLEAETWHFYCLTYNGAEVSTYMDGKRVFSYPFSLPLIKNDSPLFIGVDEPGAKEFFSGALDDIRIYNSCLSESKLMDLYYERPATTMQNEFELPIHDNILLYSNNSCEAQADFQIYNPIGVCGTVAFTQIEGLPSGSNFPVGKNRIRFEANSTSGYKETLTFYVNVRDTVPPAIEIPTDTVIYIPYGENGIVYRYNDPMSSDNCKIKWYGLKKGIPSSDMFPVGDNTLTFAAEDMSGNSTEVSCKVIVKQLPSANQNNSAPIDTLSYTQSVNDSNLIIVNDSSTYTNVTTVEFKDTLSVLKYKPNNIIFLMDVSSSMKSDNKLDYLKKAIQTIIGKLRSIDRITVLTYADSVSGILYNEPVLDKSRLINRVAEIKANGSTEAEAAITTAYEFINKNYLADGNNDIYMGTDGVFTISKKIKKIITSSAHNKGKKVTLNILAFGKSAVSLLELKEISDLGEGQYLNINSDDEAFELIFNQIKINSKK